MMSSHVYKWQALKIQDTLIIFFIAIVLYEFGPCNEIGHNERRFVS